jgi:hypothetical protein
MLPATLGIFTEKREKKYGETRERKRKPTKTKVQINT